MKICAIISEYNPFHAGHLLQIQKIRKKMPDCLIVSIMSGNYVQRGEPALWDKYFRAACAVRAGGPDLVLELPLTAALSSAEGFAQGGVQLVASIGCVTHLSFGCETGTEENLLTLASLLESDAFAGLLRQRLANGISYAQAAEQAVSTLHPDLAPLLRSPNDMLAVQYCRALQKNCPRIQPIAVRRIGAAHDGTPVGDIPSASYIRSLFHDNRNEEAFALLPKQYRKSCYTARRHSWSNLEAAVLPYLRRISPAYIASLPNVSEGLENRFHTACQNAGNLSELWENARSRRHPLSRIRRLTLCAYLGITQELASLPPSYATVLAMDTEGQKILKEMKKTCTLPVIIKPAQARSLTGNAEKLWKLTLSADDQYYFPLSAGYSWKCTPFRCEI
ncbi:MAG: nucleotidyltransferase family protein [Clostridia bacterium]|nr:nucleotidyltransferase family protein [Clostridia bacterium]